MHKHLLRYLFLLGFVSLSIGNLTAQNIQVEFGKNRIQYHDDFDKWWLYETDNFVSHWYGKSRYVGQTVMQLAEYDYYQIQNILEHRINDKIDILVYVDETDVKQSNIGDEDAFISTSGQTKVEGNKIFVYFNGDHQDLRRQIREGVAHVYLNAILFGSNLQELVQNTVSLKIPLWFKEGLISYIGEEWDVELDQELRYIFNLKKSRKFERIANRYPEEIGHAFWHYIANSYGKSTISNLLYLTRINKNPQKAFLYVLGIPFKTLSAQCFNYYKKRYTDEIEDYQVVNTKAATRTRAKRFQKITHLKFSPDLHYLAYITNDIGKAKLYLYDLDQQSHVKLFKTGYRNNIQSTDTNYPILAWHQTKPQLMVIFEERDVIKNLWIDLATGTMEEQLIAPDIQRIYSADFISDDEMIFSASTEGYSDLYRYSLKYRRTTRITEDFFDDLDVQYIQTSSHYGVLFASNRTTTAKDAGEVDTLLPIDQYDIYFLNLADDSARIERVTETYHANEREPYLLDDSHIAFLTDESGVVNQKVYSLGDDDVEYYLTNGAKSIVEHHARGDQLAMVYEQENRQYLYLNNLQQAGSQVPAITQYHHIKFPWMSSEDFTGVLPRRDPDRVRQLVEDTTSYLFQSEFGEPEESVFDQLDLRDNRQRPIGLSRPREEPMKFRKIEKFEFPRMIASRLKFKFNRFFSNLDNSILFNGLDTYAGTPRGFEFPPMGILLKASIADLFEDYEFEGGVRIPTSFNGSEYFLIFDNKKRRIDKRYALYRRSTLSDDENANRIHDISFIGISQWSYPFDVYSSLRLQGTVRLDRRIKLASDINTLQSTDLETQRIGLRLEYVFDNTLDVDLNIKNGTRAKVYVESLKKLNVQLFDPFMFSFDDGFMTMVGLDARHYQKLDRHSIWATRLSASTSFGSEQVVFFMGGVENWLFPQYNDQIPVPPSETFAYNGLAANMRGFRQNIRNGTSFALLNNELRIPIFKYLFQRNIHSAFLRNFQLTGFFDMGTAWHGNNPFSNDNPLNILSVENPLVKIDVNYSRQPIVFGYGAGARVYLLGYLIKLDYAWGLESGLRLNPRFYLSMGTDF